MRHEMLTQRAPFCIGVMAKKGTLSQHFVTHVVPPLGSGLELVQCFVFLALATLYPNDRLSGFAMATKTCRAAKLYQRPLNSMRSPSVLK